jgi:hypothetical protein
MFTPTFYVVTKLTLEEHDSLPYKYADLAFITPVGSSYNPPQSGLTTQNQHPATERSGQTNLAPNAPPIRNSVPSRGRGLSVKGSWGNGGMNYEELDQCKCSFAALRS